MIFDFFKRKKKIEEKKEIKEEIKPAKKVVKKKIKKVRPEEKPSEAIPEAKPLKFREKRIGEAWKILRTPQVTEKATELAKQNQYVFKVYARANKTEIKKTIEDLYGVDVLDVKIIRVPAKRRRLGRIRGWRKGYKKAIVKIKEGQKIEIMPR